MTIAMIASILLAAVPQPAQAEPEALRPGTVAIEPAADPAIPASARQTFADAVERALSDARFMALPATSRSRYIARVKVTRTTRGAVTSNAKEPGAGAAVGNWGGAIAVTLPSDKRQLRGLVVTELEVELVLREGMQPVWRGRALTAQAEGTRADAPATLAPKLANAAIRGFPAQQPEALSIP
ncbi:hypothetical protein [Sphingomonas koreensis]